MNRRGFLGSILALGAAPAIVRADSLMRIIPRDTKLWVVDNLIYDGPVIQQTNWTLIVSETFRKNKGQFMANLAASNALLDKMEKWGVANDPKRV